MGTATDGKKRRRVLFFSLASLALLLSGGCSRERRHSILTFFFDGVPPLNAVEEGPTSVSPQYIRDTGNRGPSKLNLFRHKPNEEGKCDSCHPKKEAYWMGLDFDRRGLCFNCHEHEPFQERIQNEPYLHGPVAVKACLVCHNPHESIYKGLLNDPDPKLCHQCHDKELILLNPAHLDLKEETCLPCHDPHGGAVEYFLRGEARS